MIIYWWDEAGWWHLPPFPDYNTGRAWQGPSRVSRIVRGPRPNSPLNRHRMARDVGITAEHDEVLRHCLGNEQAVEGVFVVMGQIRETQDVG